MQANASTRSDVRRAEKAARIAEAARAEVIVGIMSVANGRAWMLDLLESCHIFTNPFSADAQIMSFACGEMNIGQQLLVAVMRHCPDNYILMMRERNERDSVGERIRSEDSDGRDQGRESDDEPDSGALTGLDDDDPAQARAG